MLRNFKDTAVKNSKQVELSCSGGMNDNSLTQAHCEEKQS